MANSTLRALSMIFRHARGRVLAQALLVAPAVGLVPGLVGCSEPTIDDGSIRGTASVFVATMEDGTSRMDYRLLVGGDENDERRLVFRGEPDLATGNELKVWGDLQGNDIIVSRYELVEESSGGVGKSREAIIDGTPYAARTFAYALVNIGGGNGTYTQAAATIDVFGTGASDASVKQWFLEASYGRQDLSGSVVTGLSYTMNGCDGTSALANALRAQVNTALGMTPQHYLWYFLTNNSSCGWSGLASVGSATSPARDTWYNNSSSCVVLVQEPAHNFGMQHSSSLRCPGNVSFANDPSTCTHDEYGDRHDPMGGACRHTNAWQKAYQGWFGGCNSVRVNQSGTYTLHPLEVECNGIQVLQIPMPVTNRVIPRSGGGGNPSNDPVLYYYLELRTRTGFDSSATTYPTILVHVGPDYRSRTQSGLHTWILDMVPSSTGANSFDGMAAGQTFTDPGNSSVSFRVDALSATSASIAVTVPTNTANTCAGGGNLTAPGPSTCTGTGTGGMGGAGGGAGTGGRGGAGAGGTGGRGGAGAGGTGGRGGAGAGGGGRGGAGAGGAGAGGAGAGGAGAGGAGAGGAGAGGAGAGGASGDGGVAGMSGDGGMSGFGGDSSAGAAGFAGGGFGGDSSAGAAGLAGGAGFPTAGAGGAGVAGAGQAGSAVTAGAAGAPMAGAGPGTAGAGPGRGGGKPNIVGDDSGCGCRIDQAPPRRDAALFVGLVGLVAGGLMRRRRTRSS